MFRVTPDAPTAVFRDVWPVTYAAFNETSRRAVNSRKTSKCESKVAHSTTVALPMLYERFVLLRTSKSGAEVFVIQSCWCRFWYELRVSTPRAVKRRNGTADRLSQ
ncbi:hypothetical protein EVAR_46852_1 [Eumeta japonica]|uniref:Uncharacterized protein n=1 Tax=Eumeta variegata TaxID=151549 RepID=A0A4C1XNJ9_EUMVA|nr:hypothetical protein EVAR_46852_1 [Eumeta japonica]